MSEISKYREQKEKLEGVCNENNLVYRFRKDIYPPTLTIRPSAGMEEQMSMLEAADDQNYISPDAYISIAYGEEGIKTVTDGKFPITKTLRTKIENIFEKMCLFYCRHFYRTVIEDGMLDPKLMPMVDDDPDDQPPEAESINVTEDDDPAEGFNMDDLSNDFCNCNEDDEE